MQRSSYRAEVSVDRLLEDAKAIGIDPQMTSAVLLLRLIEEVRQVVGQAHGFDTADRAVRAAIAQAAEDLGTNKLTLVS